MYLLLRIWFALIFRDRHGPSVNYMNFSLKQTQWGGQGLEVMESRVDSQVRSFLSLIRRKYTSTGDELRPMEFGHRAQFFTLDVVTSVTFGKPWGFLERDGDVESYLEVSESITPMFGVLGSLPWLVHVMHSWPLRRFLPSDGDRVGFGRLMK